MRRWVSILRSSGQIIRSTRGGAARKFHLPAHTATLRLGLAVSAKTYGARTKTDDFSARTTGGNLCVGKRKPNAMVNGGAFSVPRWPMFSSLAPTLMRHVRDYGLSLRQHRCWIGCYSRNDPTMYFPQSLGAMHGLPTSGLALPRKINLGTTNAFRTSRVFRLAFFFSHANRCSGLLS